MHTRSRKRADRPAERHQVQGHHWRSCLQSRARWIDCYMCFRALDLSTSRGKINADSDDTEPSWNCLVELRVRLYSQRFRTLDVNTRSGPIFSWRRCRLNLNMACCLRAALHPGP